MIDIVKKFLVAGLVMGLIVLSACEKNTRKSPKVLLEEEMELLERFKETDTYKSWSEEAELVLDSVVRGDTLRYYQLLEGSGDTVRFGRRATFRYNMYYVLDSLGAEEPFLSPVALTNYGAPDPSEYIVGQPDVYSGVYVGLDIGIQFMKRYGKSRILVPSPLGANDYLTRVYEVEITYLGK
jgi:hypothetical protein